jgi:ribosomal-protein-alanine N-acetyltransferase
MNKPMIYQKNDFIYEELAEKLWEICEEAYTHGSPWTREQFLSDLKQPHTNYFVLTEKDEVLGFLGFTKVYDEIEITNVAVAKSAQGQGRARALLHFLIDQEKRKNAVQIFLEVRTSNTAAQHLYRSEKFRALGVRKNYYQKPAEDAVIMSVMLKTETMK